MTLFTNRSVNLIKKAKKSKDRDVRQANLKTELNIRDKEEILVVEKTNYIQTLEDILTKVGMILISSLALIGIAALVYPEPRQYLFNVLINLMAQLQGYFS